MYNIQFRKYNKQMYVIKITCFGYSHFFVVNAPWITLICHPNVNQNKICSEYHRRGSILYVLSVAVAEKLFVFEIEAIRLFSL